MRKITGIFLITALVACFAFAGCKGKPVVEEPVSSVSASEDPVEDYTQVETPVSSVEEAPEVLEEMENPDELKDPVLLWCDLYNPNGFNTVTGLVSNPNSVDVDIVYDLVFYKDGAEVYRGESFGNYNIAANATDVIWENWDLPNPEDVDEIKMENIYVNPAYYPAVKGSIEKDHEDDSTAYYKFAFEKDPTLANVWFLLYNDNNKNGQLDGGEIVVACYDSVSEDDDFVSYEKGGYAYTDVAVYYNAY